MNFSLSENQTEIKALASKLFSELANDERQKLVDASGSRFDPDLWQQLAETGMLGIAIDAEYGGMGFDFESLCILIEEAGRNVAPVPVICTLVSAAMVIQAFGSEQQKQLWLPKVVDGSAVLTAAIAPGALAHASESDDGSFIVDGRFSSVPYASYASGILAMADSDRGQLLFIVDPKAQGVTLCEQQSTAHEPWSEIQLSQVVITAENIVTSGDRAEQCLPWIRNRTIAANCSMAVGVTEKMMRLTASYTSQREQFGRPIATFQAVGQRAADCFIDIECFSLCTQEAVSLLSSHRQTVDDETTLKAISVAKIWCGDVTHRVSQSAQHLHGGIGVDRDYPLFRYCLWSKQLELSLGSTAQSLEKLGDHIAASVQAG